MAVKRSEVQRHISREVKAPIERPVSVDPSPFSRPAPEPAAQPPTQEEIAVAAYYRALARGFEPGHETDDWVAAERELEARSR